MTSPATPAPATAAAPARPVGSGRRRGVIQMLIIEAVLATAGALAILALIPGIDQIASDDPTASGSSGASASGPPGPSGLTPIMVAMGPDADCGACHLSPDGGVGILKIPVMAHPLEGWRDCTACHADDRLVKTAPGHTSLHKSDCLVCHKPPLLASTPPLRPHPFVEGKACLSCHDTHIAPLPSGMAGRENCWLCHQGLDFQGLFSSPAPSGIPGPTSRP